jgi:hypothetical protein
MDEIPVPDGADENQDGIFYPGAELVYLAENIRVVSSRKTLVTGYCHNGGTGFFTLGRGEEFAFSHLHA